MATATKLCTYTQSSKLYALNFVNSMVYKLYLSTVIFCKALRWIFFNNQRTLNMDYISDYFINVKLHGNIGTFRHRQWEGEVMQPLGKLAKKCSTRSGHVWPSNPTLSYTPKRQEHVFSCHVQPRSCPNVFLFCCSPSLFPSKLRNLFSLVLSPSRALLFSSYGISFIVNNLCCSSGFSFCPLSVLATWGLHFAHIHMLCSLPNVFFTLTYHTHRYLWLCELYLNTSYNDLQKLLLRIHSLD